jgi:hypothetical protein
VKRRELIRHLKAQGCRLVREAEAEDKTSEMVIQKIFDELPVP